MRGTIALVTGANSGMGLATTVELARKGAKVIMVCRNRQREKKHLLPPNKRATPRISSSCCVIWLHLRAFAALLRNLL